LLFLKGTSFSLRQDVVYAAVPKRLKFKAGSGRLSFLTQHKTIQVAVRAAERLIVNLLRMLPIFMIVVVGAVGTFIVNVLRIVSIYIIGLNSGAEAATAFHSYYGELYFIAWILIYFFAIIYGPKILTKLRKIGHRL